MVWKTGLSGLAGLSVMLAAPTWAQSPPTRSLAEIEAAQQELAAERVRALEAQQEAAARALMEARRQYAETYAQPGPALALAPVPAPVAAPALAAAAAAPVAAPAPAPAPAAGGATAAQPRSVTQTNTTTTAAGTTEQKVETIYALDQSETNSAKFGGLEWGIGLAFSYDLGGSRRAKAAELDANGIVRVTDWEDADARFILETHYLFTPTTGYFASFLNSVLGVSNTPKEKTWGFGPFIAVQPSEENVISAVGAGLMLGFRRPKNGDSADPRGESFNVGLGVLYDLDVQLLGDGIEANKPLPAGEVAPIRFKETTQSGFLVLTSFSF